MVDTSHLFTDILTGSCNFSLFSLYVIGSSIGPKGIPYLFVNSIYPSRTIFAEPIHKTGSEMESEYTRRREALIKNIERCLGVLQARFGVLRVENKMWYLVRIIEQGQACVVLHSMIVEMMKHGELESEIDDERQPVDVLVEESIETGANTSIREEMRPKEWDHMLARRSIYTSALAFESLRGDLTQHVWGTSEGGKYGDDVKAT